uniref:Uncharacterized protein n=1 Tax=Arundo donax TaxID=35708 RepID=A0A0A8Z430_ARUDO
MFSFQKKLYISVFNFKM